VTLGFSPVVGRACGTGELKPKGPNVKAGRMGLLFNVLGLNIGELSMMERNFLGLRVGRGKGNLIAVPREKTLMGREVG